jgi:hypothetical protein
MSQNLSTKFLIEDYFADNSGVKMTVDMEKYQKTSTFRRILPQILASTAKNLLLLDLGMAVSFPTIVIPALSGLKLHDRDNILSFTPQVKILLIVNVLPK